MDPTQLSTTHSTTADVHIPFHAISVPAANLLPKGHQDNAADSDANVLSALTTMMNDEPDGTQPIEVRRDETPPDETPHEETNHDETNHEETNHDETNHDEINHDETNHDETTYGDAPNTAMTVSPLEFSPPRQTPSNCNGNILPRMCRAHVDDMCSMVVRIKRVYLHKLHAHNVKPIDDDTDKYLLGNICCENCIEVKIDGEMPSSTGSSSSSEGSRSFRGVWGELKSTMADTDQVLLSHRAVFLGGISSVLSLLLLCFLCFACRSSSSSGGTSKHYEYENEEGGGSATGGRSSSGETEGLLEKSPSHRSTKKSKSTNRKKYARRKKGVENSDRD